ncbi:PucR family transcriptional regulator ligand-binding domain-containing protein [Streptomyces sp. MS2A]|nr:PucR family transcriptional regulator ligand-binding domain-containing protein [Streptomyces sp. MS2A]
MVSLGALVRTAGSALRPLAPFDAARPLTGVHVSELDDPGRYLDGGELLLTTGIPLLTRSIDAYVDRLRASGIGAIGIGLGEGWDDAPSALIDACRDHGIPLFAVPDGVPFLDVSRAYWSLSGQGGRDEAARAAHAHTRLAQAAAGRDPITSVVRQLAQAIGGWVAWLPFGRSRTAERLHPASLEGMLPAVRDDVERSILRSGARAASFVSHGSAVVAHAVTDGADTIGAIALGTGRPLSRADQQLALTASALIGLALAPAPTGPERWIAELALAGEASAARALARTAGVALPASVRVLASAASSGHALSASRDGLHVALVPADVVPDGTLGVLSAPVAMEDVPSAAARMRALHRTTAPDDLVVEPESRAARWAEALANADPALERTVVAYLRQRHQTERAARELGVHRNTVRPRLVAAERLLEASLDDPDVAAELWIALRDRGA